MNASLYKRRSRDRGRATYDQRRPALTLERYAERPFVVVDGEGVTLPNGEHVYTLLGDSTGRATVNALGLGTRECFDFLLGLADQLVCGFAFGYDINMLLRDVPESDLRRLHERGRTYWRDPRWPGRLRYRIAWVPRKSFAVSRYRGDVKECSVTVWETWGFFQSSFVKALTDWKIGTDAERETIAGMKDKRSDFLHVAPESVAAYNALECKLGVELLTALRDTLTGAGIRLARWDGAGAVAGAMMRAKNVKVHKREPPPDVQDAALRAYFGGRIQALWLGDFAGPVHGYDLVSAYPSVLQNLPSLVGRWEWCDEYDPSVECAIWRVVWRVPDAGILTPFPLRYKSAHVCYPHSGQGWYHASIVRVAVAGFGAGIDVRGGWRFVPESGALPFAWIRDTFEQRLAYKRAGDPRHVVLKLGLNSLYGKTAQSVGWNGQPPPVQSYVWAGMVTAGTQARMLEAALHAPDQIIAFTTDGIYSRVPLPLDLSGELGTWEHAELKRFFVVQPGVAVTWQNGKRTLKTRGFKASELDVDALIAGWRARGTRFEMPVTVTRFQGLAYSLHTGRMQDWRRWIEQERVLTCHPAHGSPLFAERLTTPAGTDAVSWAPLMAPQDQESQPYDARSLRELDSDQWAREEADRDSET